MARLTSIRPAGFSSAFQSGVLRPREGQTHRVVSSLDLAGAFGRRPLSFLRGRLCSPAADRARVRAYPVLVGCC